MTTMTEDRKPLLYYALASFASGTSWPMLPYRYRYIYLHIRLLREILSVQLAQ
jgi:hypothetical protein